MSPLLLLLLLLLLVPSCVAVTAAAAAAGIFAAAVACTAAAATINISAAASDRIDVDGSCLSEYAYSYIELYCQRPKGQLADNHTHIYVNTLGRGWLLLPIGWTAALSSCWRLP